MTPMDYIHLDFETLKLKISRAAQMLLGLIKGFSGNGDCLRTSNKEIADLLGCSENHVIKLLKEIRQYIRIENPQSRYRRIFYSIQNDLVDDSTQSKRIDLNDSTQSKRIPTQSISTPTQSKTIDITKETKLNKYILQFEQARKLYPGTKRGQQTEYKNFRKKHRDWKEVLPLLKSAIERQIAWRKNGNGEFRPAWKHFSTWINKRNWEDEPQAGTTTEIPFDDESAAERERQLAKAKNEHG